MEEDQFDIEQTNINEITSLISNLDTSQKTEIKGIFNLDNILRKIETSAISISIKKKKSKLDKDKKQELLGLLILDYNNENFLSKKGGIWKIIEEIPNLKMRPYNTLLLDLLIFKKMEDNLEKNEKIAKKIKLFKKLMQFVFQKITELEFIIFYPPSQSYKKTHYHNIFDDTRLFREISQFKILQKNKILKSLKIRIAKEEDQDNLSQICNTQTELQTSIFGNFFLSEMISSQSKDKICLVAENFENKVVGILVASDQVDYEVLIKNYDLGDFKYFTKSDFFMSYKDKRKAFLEIEGVVRKFEVLKDNEKMMFFKKIHSKDFLILQLQEYCVKEQKNILNEFASYIDNEENQKKLKKSVLKSRFEKHLKNHKIEIPNKIFIDKQDLEIETCIMNPLDLLFETLVFYNLSKNYLDGEGHWDEWLKRKIEEKKEENKQKGFLGKKKKNRNKKKRYETNKENNELKKPTRFDIEPFYISLTKFIKSDIKMRKKICQILTKNKKSLIQLFVKENFELKKNRCVDFDDIFHILNTQLDLNIEDQVIDLIPHILVCFGGLRYDVEKVKFFDKGKGNRKFKKAKEKILRKVSFHELFEAVERIREFDGLLRSKDVFLENLETVYVEKIKKRKIGIFEKFKKNRKFDKHFEIKLKKDEFEPEGGDLENLEKAFYDVPENIHNLICINMFFIDEKYKNFSLDFIPYIFDYFKNKDYLIISLPNNSLEFPLLKNFMLAPKKKISNFSHCLYFFHRLNTLNKFLKVKIIKKRNENLKKLKNDYIIKNGDIVFSVDIDVPDKKIINVGFVIGEKNLNLDYLKKNFDLSDFLIQGCYRRNEFLKLKFFRINKYFENSYRFILREILRLTKTKILFKNQKNKNLNFLHNFFTFLKPLEIKKLKKEVSKKKKRKIKITALNMNSLTLPKTKINSRIFIIGASKSSLGFLNYILNNKNYIFTNLTLISSSFNWQEKFVKIKASEKNYTKNIIDNILLKVNLIYGTLETLNRKSKFISFRSVDEKEYFLEYDILILCNSFEEKTFQAILQKKENSKIEKPSFLIPIHSINNLLKKKSNEIGLDIINKKKSQFYQPLNYDCFFKKKKNLFINENDFFKQLHRNINSPHPYCKDLHNFRNLLTTELNWFSLLLHPKDPYKLIFYGFSLEIFVTMKDMIDKWKIKPENIILIIPREIEFEKNNYKTNTQKIDHDENLIDFPIAFKKAEIWKFYSQKLLSKNITIINNYEITDFTKDEIELTNKNLEKKPPNPKQKPNLNFNKIESLENILDDFEKYIVILGDTFDISDEIFNTIQDNGLVYNGRLIVQSDYKTIDDSIFGSGKICEFSQRYKNSSFGRSLRMDKYNQFEVGGSFGRKFLNYMESEERDDELPVFKRHIGVKVELFLGFYYVDVFFPYLGKIDFDNCLEYEVCDKLEGKNYYICFGFDENDVLKHLVYFGKTNLEFSSLEKLMKLHRNHFNYMFKRFEGGLIDDFLEFLNQPWAEILYHPHFEKFQKILDKLLESKMDYAEILKNKDEKHRKKEIIEMIENTTIDYIKENKENFINYLI